ncbi:MAG: polysaccharide biosynthesis protein [Hydrogenophilales bacterium 28-61-23]|nr:MAG: polysaccharide biosynthesis protein [Hydrogenophilales bacterium 28-61-23]
MRYGRSLLVIVHDLTAAALAWLAAFWFRFNLALPPEFQASALSTLFWVVPVQAALFWYFGLYRGIWRFASLPDLKRILKAVAIGAVAVPTLLILFRVQEVVPRSVLLLDPILLVLLMGGSRFAYRAWKDHRFYALMSETKPVLILGAGSASDFLLREMARTPTGYQAVGLLDDDPAKVGRHIQGIQVLGLVRDIERWQKKTGVRDAILAMPSAPPAVRKAVVETCAGLGLNLLTVPSMNDLMQGRVSVESLRKIELDDLLGREPVKLDNQGLHELLTGKVVMVTGAGGSIGSELCRQLARFNPSLLVMLEQGEFALYGMEQEFAKCHPAQALACAIGDVKDAARIGQVMRDYRPDVVFHAAAYKHVPLMEQVNALQAVKNNVLGTWVVASAAREAGVGRFVMISTDKAVNPTNVMGASKRLAEMVCQSLQREEGGGVSTRFVSVRFGNVLGSSGSVIPKFQKQIEAGGPVTVTHPEITRFFMSIPEAAQLVLQAGLMGRGGEIFVLDMGDSIRIADLARLMIRLSGKSEDEIHIEYSGLRPGEKLYEEVLADAETTLPTPHPKLRVASARQVDLELVESFLGWIGSTDSAADAEVRAQLRAWLPGEYRPDAAQAADVGAGVSNTTSSNSVSIESRTPTLSSSTSSATPLA